MQFSSRSRALVSVLAILSSLAMACGGSRGPGGPGGDGNKPGADSGPTPDVDSSVVVPTEEVCNGSDDDADNAVDEGCPCQADTTQSCFPGPVDQPSLERCTLGVQTCQTGVGEFGAWAACEGARECAVTEQTFIYGEEENVRPVDIIFVVDQSGSMSEEIAAVKTNINTFATTFANSGLDYRVIMLASRSLTSQFNICVAPPLAGPSCADAARFMQVDKEVDSWDSLEQIRDNIAQIETFTRPDSLRAFIEVTDDDAAGLGDSYGIKAQPFHDFITARPGWSDYVFNSVIGDGTCPDEADVGTEYQMLSMWTKGLTEKICTPDWSKTFSNFATNIIAKTLLYPLNEVPFDVAGVDFVDPASGQHIPQARGVVWDYNPKSNSVVLFDGFTPEPGTQIIVKYRKVVD